MAPQLIGPLNFKVAESAAPADLFEEKLNLAKELGATYTIDASKANPIEEIKKFGGADFAICVAVSPKAFEQAFGSLRRGGTAVFVGLPADQYVQLSIFEIVGNNIKIVGSTLGNRVDLAKTFELHAAGKTKVITEVRKLEQVNEAFAEVIVEQPRKKNWPGSTTFRSHGRQIYPSVTTSHRVRRFLPFASIQKHNSVRSMRCNGD